MPASNTQLDGHLQKVVGAAGYSVSGSTVTIPSVTVSATQLAELARVAVVTRHELSLVAGVLTLKPV
jgi:hypothetical protein